MSHHVYLFICVKMEEHVHVKQVCHIKTSENISKIKTVSIFDLFHGAVLSGPLRLYSQYYIDLLRKQRWTAKGWKFIEFSLVVGGFAFHSFCTHAYNPAIYYESMPNLMHTHVLSLLMCLSFNTLVIYLGPKSHIDYHVFVHTRGIHTIHNV